MLLAFFIICSLFRGLQSWGYYTIVAPGTFRSKSEYHVAVSLDNFFKSCSFRITLNGNYEVIANTSIEVEPMTTKLVKIQLPNLFYGYGSLQVDGYRGIISKDFSRVNIEERQYTVYIQTDKSKYKAGDRMQFRALFLDRLIRPVKLDDVIDVLIYDGQKNLIRKFTGIKLLKGVFKGHLQLSEHPVLGQWCIEVNVGGEILREEYFEVARYVLPKFSVEINAKKNVGVIEGKMDIKVKSSYAHDQPVKGNLALNFNSELTALGCSAINMTHEFNGEASITIDFIKDLNIQDVSSLYRSDICVYEVTAIVTDGLTQQSQSASTDLFLFFQPFKIKVEAPGFLDPTDSLPITVSVTDLEGISIQDSTNPVTISVTASKVDINRVAEVVSDNQFQSSEMDWTLEKTVYLNQIGVGVTEFEVPRAEFISEFKARAKYLNYSSYSVYVKRNTVGTMKLEVMTERPEVGKELAIRVKSKGPIGYFIYEMMSRGDIVQSARVDVPGNSNEHLLCIPVTFSMVPKVTIFVHNIKNGIFNSRLKEVYVRRAFKNHINITADHTEVLPGALVSLNITTDPGSYVGLLGINEKVLININNKATTTEDNIFTELRNYDSINVADEVHPGSEAGFITFSNARNKAGEVIGSAAGSLGPGVFHPLPEPFVKPSIDLPHMRALFSDNWIFADFESTPDEGLKLIETVPETITTWAVTGFSLNPDTGLTLTKYPTKLKVFQKFFISMDLPSSIKVGEIIEIPVYVSNHLDHNLPTNVTMINLGDDFELLEKLDSENRAQPIQTFQRSIPANGTEKVIYLIKPLKVGRFRVTVMATSPEARDVVQKNLTVEPDGVPYSIAKTFLINLLEYNEEHLTEAFVQIPENAVPLSENVQISVIGDVFGPLIRTIQNFVRAPFGSSETSLKYFLSNLWVLKYLKVIGHSNPCLESKAKLFLESGYQTLLSFKHLDGSFSRFNRFRERTGDTRLTAFILSAFQQAEEFIQLDQKVVQRGLDYLKSKQAENGGFRSGKDVDEDAVLTSFIMLAFLVKEKNHSMYESITSKGLTYLYDTLDDLKEPTPVAISMYVLIVGRHKKSGELLKKLGSQVVQKDQRHQWAGRDTIQSNMETTTYSFMSLLESQELPLNNLLPIVKSLISVTKGKWTHTHILALQAMIKFAHHLHFKTNRLDIHFENDNNETGDFKVNSSNAQILQQITLKKSCRSIKFRTKGKGFALISVNYNYNLVSQNRTSSNYETSVRVNEPNNWTMSLDICTAMRLSKTQSHLTIVDVKPPSGYSVSDGNFEKIKKDNDLVKGIELNQSDQSVRIYLENISQNGTCILLTGSKTSSLFNLKPMTIDVYDGINESMTE